MIIFEVNKLDQGKCTFNIAGKKGLMNMNTQQKPRGNNTKQKTRESGENIFQYNEK